MVKVSIVIPVHNLSSLTDKCLSSIEKHTKIEHEIIVIDNASTDNTEEILKKHEVKVIKNKENESFSKSINQGALASSSGYIVSLNNDTEVTDNWLTPLIETAEKDPKIALVGSKLLNPDSTIQHSGILFDKELYPYHFCRNLKPSFLTDQEREFPAVTFASCLIKKSIFHELNGLSEEYERCNYEDVDFCLRLRKIGYKILYQPKSVVYHDSCSTKLLEPEIISIFTEKNLKIFQEKAEKNPELLGNKLTNYPKVLVGCPISDHKAYCMELYLKAVTNLEYPNYDILLIDNSKDNSYFDKVSKVVPVMKSDYKETARERIVTSRNILRENFLKGNYDYLLSLEQDVIPPLNIIEALMQHDKDITTAVYYSSFNLNGKNVIRPLLWKEFTKDKMIFMTEEAEIPQMTKVRACGLGAVLIKKNVLEKIKFRFDPSSITFDDMYFCEDAVNSGFDIFADTSIKCRHMISQMDWSKIIK